MTLMLSCAFTLNAQDIGTVSTVVDGGNQSKGIGDGSGKGQNTSAGNGTDSGGKKVPSPQTDGGKNVEPKKNVDQNSVGKTNNGGGKSTNKGGQSSSSRSTKNYITREYLQKKLDSISECNQDTLNKYLNKISDIEAKIDTLNSKCEAFSQYENGAHEKVSKCLFYSIVSAFVVLFLVLLFLHKRKFKNEIDEINKRIDNKRKDEISKIQEELSSLKMSSSTSSQKKHEELCKKIENLEAQVAKLQRNQSEPSRAESRTMSPDMSNSQRQPEVQKTISLFSDFIDDGVFNNVKKAPNDDSVFELVLSNEDANTAKVIVYPSAYKRVIANPSFLEGCEKQILGETDVIIEREGTAEKDSSTGEWKVVTPLSVIIK